MKRTRKSPSSNVSLLSSPNTRKPPLQPSIFSIFGWPQRTTQVDPTQMDNTAQQSMIRRSRKPAGLAWICLDHSSLELAKHGKKSVTQIGWLCHAFFSVALWALAKSDLGRSKWNPAGSWTFWSCSVALCGPFVLDRPQSFAVAIQKCWKPEAVMEGFPVIETCKCAEQSVENVRSSKFLHTCMASAWWSPRMHHRISCTHTHIIVASIIRSFIHVMHTYVQTRSDAYVWCDDMS